jgi:serine/threonine-protein kinase
MDRGHDPDPEAWQRLEALYQQAIELPESERRAFLQDACAGDGTLREKLEALLDCSPAAHGFFERMSDAIRSVLPDTEHARHDSLPGSVFGRYRVDARLGAGGMGTVYRGFDLHLQRPVALKFLHVHVSADDDARRRLLMEARAAAALNHPNVCTVYETGDTETGTPFLVMAYCEGISLKERVAPGRLAPSEALHIAIQMARGLSAAHARGMVHRDVKPGNVIIGDDGLVKLVDFGLARVHDATLSATGALRGTVAYMAPELLRGQPPDARSDLWSLGVVLHEMLTGSRAFHGDTDAAQVYAIVHKERRGDLPVDAPIALRDVLDRLLEKDPAARYGSALQVQSDLEAILSSMGPGKPTGSVETHRPARKPGAGAQRRDKRTSLRLGIDVAVAATAIALVGLFGWRFAAGRSTQVAAIGPTTSPRVAVMFFHDETEQASAGSIANDITAGLIDALGAVPGIHVPSMNVVLPYRDRRLSVTAMADTLGAEWLVGGVVSRSNDSTTVKAELSDATGRRLDSREIHGRRGDEQTLVDEVVLATAVMVRERLGAELRARRWTAGTRSEQARRLIRQATLEREEADELEARTQPRAALARLFRADSTLVDATSADPSWPEPWIERAWIARSITFLMLGIGYNRDTIFATIATGMDHAGTALQFGQDSARALEVRGTLRYALWLVQRPHTDTIAGQQMLGAVERDLLQALNRDSTLVPALNVLSATQFARGELELSRVTAQRAYRQDNWFQAEELLYRLFNTTFETGYDAEARHWCDEIRKRFPNTWFVAHCELMLMAWSPEAVPDPNQAWDMAREAAANAEDPIRQRVRPWLEILVAGVLARAQHADSAALILDRVRTTRNLADPNLTPGSDAHVVGLNLEAGVRLLLGQKELAIERLNEYFDYLPDERVVLFEFRRFRELRDDPRLRVRPIGPP